MGGVVQQCCVCTVACWQGRATQGLVPGTCLVALATKSVPKISVDCGRAFAGLGCREGGQLSTSNGIMHCSLPSRDAVY